MSICTGMPKWDLLKAGSHLLLPLAGWLGVWTSVRVVCAHACARRMMHGAWEKGKWGPASPSCSPCLLHALICVGM